MDVIGSAPQEDHVSCFFTVIQNRLYHIKQKEIQMLIVRRLQFILYVIVGLLEFGLKFAQYEKCSW